MSVRISGVLTEVFLDLFQSLQENTRVLLDFCLTVHHQLGKVIQMNQLDATLIHAPDDEQNIARNMLS